MCLVVVGVWAFGGACKYRDPRTGAPVVRPPTNLKVTSSPDKDPSPTQEGLTGGKLVFSDNFDRSELGSDWQRNHEGWVIVDGTLQAPKAENLGVWLTRKLPGRVRVEFTAWAMSSAGDIKCEVFARKPRHELGYSLIFGGWNNTLSVIGRLGEHSADRIELHNKPKVVLRRKYRFQVVRTNNILRWYLDGKFYGAYDDPKPIRGRYFGFNNWRAPVFFDDVAVYAVE